MKLYHCCLLIFFAVIATAEEDNEAEGDNKADVTTECDIRLKMVHLKEQLCELRLVGRHEFRADYNATIAKFNETGVEAPEVPAFFNKYCGVMTEFFNCMTTIQLSEEILKCETITSLTKMQPTYLKGIKLIVNHGCDNNAENLKKLLPHDGFRFIFLNSDIDRCHGFASNVDTREEFCEFLDQPRSCYLEVVGDHPNKDIPVMINEVFATIKTAIGC